MCNELFETSLSGFELDIHLSDLKPHFYASESGRDYSTFIFIIDGEVDISSGTHGFNARGGEFFCIPARTRCRAVWSNQNGNVKFYSIHLTEKPSHSFCGDFSLIKLPEFSNDATLARVEEIFYLMQGSDIEKLRAVSKFIDLCCDIRPLLDSCPNRSLSKSLCDALAIIESDFKSNISVAELAERVHVSQSKLFNMFKTELNQTPINYRNELRISKAVRLLESTDMTVSEVAEAVGFKTQSHFRKLFKKLIGSGVPPRAYIKFSV